MVRFDDQRARSARARPPARRSDADLAAVDLPERGTNHRKSSFDPARITTRHAGQTPADLSRHGRNAGGLSGWKWRAFDEVRVAQLQSQHDAVVRHPFARQLRQVEEIPGEERCVSQGVPGHSQEVARTFEHRTHVARQRHRVEDLQRAAHQDGLGATVDQECGSRIALRDDRFRRVARCGHPHRTIREAVNGRVHQRQAARAQSQHADRGAAQDRARLSGQLHAPKIRTPDCPECALTPVPTGAGPGNPAAWRSPLRAPRPAAGRRSGARSGRRRAPHGR